MPREGCGGVDTNPEICSHALVKIVLPVVLLVSLVLTSCTTLANRRDMYTYDQPDGPWTRKWKLMNHIRPN
jgi:hypothetical protein